MPRSYSRLKAEQCLRLDVRRLASEDMLRPGSWAWHWRGDDGDSIGSISIVGGVHEVHLMFRSGDAQVSQRVRIERTPCPFGGSRAWFSCPRCHTRVAVLHMRGSRFACRRCHGLAYVTQGLDATGRAWRKQSKLERLLGPDGEKPKGMHWKTYDALIERIDECDAIRDAQLLMALQRLGITLDEAMCG